MRPWGERGSGLKPGIAFPAWLRQDEPPVCRAPSTWFLQGRARNEVRNLAGLGMR
jgi:hypothetical protein